MGRFDSTKTAIDVNITQNGNQEITGSILNSVLNNMVDATDAQLDILEGAIPTKLSDLEQDIPIGSYDDTELRQELTKLSAEVEYSSAVRGVIAYDEKALSAIESIWVIKWDETAVPSKLYFQKIKNTTGNTNAIIRLGTSADDNTKNLVLQYYLPQGIATGKEEVIINGYSSYYGKITIGCVINWDNIAGEQYIGCGEYDLTKANTEKVESISVKDEVKSLNAAVETIQNDIDIANYTTQLMGVYNAYGQTSKRSRIDFYIDDIPSSSPFYLKISSKDYDYPYFNIYTCDKNHSGLKKLMDAPFGEFVKVQVADIANTSLFIYKTDVAEVTGEEKHLFVEMLCGDNIPMDIENLKKSVEGATDSWVGKRIVCLGDSLTEFADIDNGLRYTEYMTAITQAEVVNIGFGGTQFRQRTIPKPMPTTSSEAYAAVDMINVVKSCCSNDFSLQESAATFLSNTKMSEIINVAKSINWREVDVVTIFAGTNDWNNGSDSWGEPTKENTDVNTTFGAINEIVRLLISTYPHLVIYWFTPTVRWIASSLAERTDDTWSDNAKRNNTTLKEFSADVEDLVKLHHIPICDMYNTLGWNQYNFSQYFADNDGTHPRKGKGTEQIARKMVAFINANSSFW